MTGIKKNTIVPLYQLLCRVWPLIPYHFDFLHPYIPPFIYIFSITHKCNVNCWYCCQKQSIANAKPDLPASKIVEISQKLPWYATIVLSGGEPLYRDDFLEILNQLNRNKKKIALLTNGLLLSEKITTELIKNKLLSLGIAIDGFQPYYDKLKGQGNYERLMTNIQTLIDLKRQHNVTYPLLDWKVTVFPENLPDLPKLYAHANKIGADTFTVSLPKKNSLQFNDCLCNINDIEKDTKTNATIASSSLMSTIYSELFTMSKKMSTRLRWYPRLRQPQDIKNYFHQEQITKRYSPCKEPWCVMGINASGEMYPCLSVRLGDLKEKKVTEILKSKTSKQFYSRLKKEKLFNACDGCCYASIRPMPTNS